MARLTALSVAALMAVGFAQTAADDVKKERLPPGTAQLTAAAAASVPRSGLVMIDSMCLDDDADYVRGRVAAWLGEQGFTVEDRAPLVLRLEINPCEDDGALSGRGPLEDAYKGGSSPDEYARAAPLVRVPFGKAREGDVRVSARFLLFAPGEKPLWSASIVGQDTVANLRHYKARLVATALTAYGESADRLVTIE